MTDIRAGCPVIVEIAATITLDGNLSMRVEIERDVELTDAQQRGLQKFQGLMRSLFDLPKEVPNSTLDAMPRESIRSPGTVETAFLNAPGTAALKDAP